MTRDTGEHNNGFPAADRFAARWLLLTFFLPGQAQVLATMAASVYFVLRTVMLRGKVPGANFRWALLLGSLFLLFLLALPFTQPQYVTQLMSICEGSVSLLLMPLAFAIISPLYGRLIAGEAMHFVYACFLVCLAGNAAFIYHAYLLPGGVQYQTQVHYRSMVHYFVNVHPTYMSMYLCFAISILLFDRLLAGRWGMVIRYVLLCSLLIFLLALGAKSPILAMVLIFLHYAYKNRTVLARHKLLLSSLLAACIAACYFIPFISQRISETIKGLTGKGDTSDNSVAMRKVIWHIDTSLLRHYWLQGVGPGGLKHVLSAYYLAYSLSSPLAVPYHDPHSEYFYMWLSFGVVGIGALVAVLFVHLRKAIFYKDHLYLYLLIILSTTFFTETVLSLQLGVLFYSVLTSMYFFLPRAQRQ